MFSVVRRIWNSNTVKITTCTTRASAATMLKISSHTCIRAPPAPQGAEPLSRHWSYDCFDSRRYASRPASTAAEIESFLRTATSFPRSINSSARSRSSRAFFCAYSLPSSAFFVRKSRVSSPAFGAKSTPTRAPRPSPSIKYVTLEPTLSAMTPSIHSKGHRSTAKVRPQWPLTGIVHSKRLMLARMLRRMLQACENSLRAFSRNDRTQLFYARTLNIRDASEFFEQFLRSLRTDAGNFIERAAGLPLAAALTVKRNGKAVGLVANLLNQMQD